jgi:hypothetical protein
VPNIPCSRRWRDASVGLLFGNWQKLWSTAPARLTVALDKPDALGRTYALILSFGPDGALIVCYLIISDFCIENLYYCLLSKTILSSIIHDLDEKPEIERCR